MLNYINPLHEEIEKKLTEQGLSHREIFNTQLMLEEVILILDKKVKDPETEARIAIGKPAVSVRRRMGESIVRFSYVGDEFNPFTAIDLESEDPEDLGGKILTANRPHLGYSYKNRTNIVTIQANTNKLKGLYLILS